MPEQRQPTDAPRIDLSQAREKFETDSALFVDLRGREEYEDSHIPGALSIPLKEILCRVDELPRDQPIIFC